MRLFRKHRTSEELGELLYEALRSGMESGGELSTDRLLDSIDRTAAQLDEQFRGEIIVGLMFGATLAIERSATARVATRIAAGMKAEFMNHQEEQGATAIQRAEWEAVIASRFLSYRMSLEGYTGFEPPWKLGREFYWNIIGEQDYTAMSIKIATLYLLSARDFAQVLLNEHGPYLVAEPGPSPFQD